MMKKLLLLTLVIISVQFSYAQKDASADGVVFKKFKVDISGGYAKPQGKGYNAGALFAIEPKYAVMNQLSVGLRLEAALMARIDPNNTDNSSVKANASYVLTGDYYFNNNKLRPFGGAGLGMFTTASIDSSTVLTTADEIPTKQKFGFMARAGIEYGHFRLGLEYNFVGDKNGYFGIKIGACIGGGRK